MGFASIVDRCINGGTVKHHIPDTLTGVEVKPVVKKNVKTSTLTKNYDAKQNVTLSGTGFFYPDLFWVLDLKSETLKMKKFFRLLVHNIMLMRMMDL